MDRTITLLLLLSLVTACDLIPGASDDDDSASGDDDDASDDDDATPDLPQPAPAGEPSGTCPDLTTSGLKTFQSGGIERSVLIEVSPDLEPGAPVLFFWHAFGTSANDWYTGFDLARWAEENEGLLLMPQAVASRLFEWDWVSTPDQDDTSTGTAQDVAVFDDLRACAARDLDVDLGRVYTAGFSAGAVWSTFLTMHRADRLAASYLMSGGTVVNLPWSPPAVDIPSMAMDGGPTDVWPSPAAPAADFHHGTIDYTNEMLAEDQFVVRCAHEGGHTPGPGARTWMDEFLIRHTYGVESPFAGERAGDIPAGCWDAAELGADP